MVEIACDLDRGERAEDFVGQQGMIGGQVMEQGGGDPATRLRPAGRGRGVGERKEPLLRGAVDHRANLGGGVIRIAETERGDLRSQAIGEVAGDVGQHDHAADRGAALTREAEHGGGEIGGGEVEIGGGIDDRRVAAAELGLDRERVVTGGGDDRATRWNRTRETEQVERFAVDHRPPGRRAAGDEGKTISQPHFRQSGMKQAGDGGALERRLPQHAIAVADRRGELAERDGERVVPRRDQPGEADRAIGDLAVRIVQRRRDMIEQGEAIGDFALSIAARFGDRGDERVDKGGALLRQMVVKRA